MTAQGDVRERELARLRAELARREAQQPGDHLCVCCACEWARDRPPLGCECHTCRLHKGKATRGCDCASCVALRSEVSDD